MNHLTVQEYLVTTNIVETVALEDLVKGLKLTVCSSLMIISYVFYLIRFVKKPAQKELSSILCFNGLLVVCK